MQSITLLNVLLGGVVAVSSALLNPQADGGFSIGHPGDIKDIIISNDNTLNSTKKNDGETEGKFILQAVSGNLPVQFVNNFDGGSVNAYINGLDSNGNIVFVGANGKLIYPTANGSLVPVRITDSIGIPMPTKDQNSTLIIPIAITSGRIYFCEGDLSFFVVSTSSGNGIVQPSVTNLQDSNTNLNWGFAEFTYTKEKVVYANISYVDFVGMILSMSLSTTDDSGTQITKGLQANAVQSICNGLVDQSSKDGWPWRRMCVSNGNGQPLRALSPNYYANINMSAFQDYWEPYIDQVWAQYTNHPLIINTQTSTGNVNCQVSGSQMSCNGDNRPYSKPTTADIWGCNSGPFGNQENDNDIHRAVIPRLCAAFTRSTFLLQGGNIQPNLAASSYYTVNPTNHYSSHVHENESDGRGYAFSYDDVNPENENASGLVSSSNPETLVIYFGGYP